MCEEEMVFGASLHLHPPIPSSTQSASHSLSDLFSCTSWNSHSPFPYLGLSLLLDSVSRRTDSIIYVVGKREIAILIYDEKLLRWGSCEHSDGSLREVKKVRNLGLRIIFLNCKVYSAVVSLDSGIEGWWLQLQGPKRELVEFVVQHMP